MQETQTGCRRLTGFVPCQDGRKVHQEGSSPWGIRGVVSVVLPQCTSVRIPATTRQAGTGPLSRWSSLATPPLLGLASERLLLLGESAIG